MAYLRIYENIYSFPVRVNQQSTGGVVTANNQKIFFSPCPMIVNKTVKAISISYPSLVFGIYNQAFLTFKNSKGDILLYNYPLLDLQDCTNVISGSGTFRLRLFNLYDIDLQQSFYFYNNITFPIGLNDQLLFNINFHLN